MRRLRLDEDIRPLTEFRANAARLIDRVRETRRSLVLTQRGHSTAVVVDVREYEQLLEELELLRDLQSAERELTEGRGVGHEQAREQVLAALAR